MTYPATMLLPSVAVYVDGQWVADGRNPYSTDPQVLTGLVVRWGRSTVVDQPQPSTCSLTLLDTQGGSRFLDSIQLGMRLDVVADALLATTPGPGTGVVVIDETFTSGPGNAYVGGVATIAASGGVLLVTSAGEQSVSVVVPPGPREPVGGNPAAWDAIPRAAQGQTWTASVDVKLPAPFAGYSGWAVQVYPVTYDSPWDTATALAELGTRADLGNGWVRVSGEFIPPTGAWLGVQVRLWPTGPAWDELPGGPPTTRHNLANDPRATNGPGGWINHGWGPGGAGTMTFPTVPDGPPVAANTAMTVARKTWSAPSAATPAVNTGYYVLRSSTANDFFPVTPGVPYTVSCYWRHTSAKSKMLSLVAYLYDAAKVYQGYAVFNGPSTPAGSAWQRAAVTFTPAANVAYLRPTPTQNSGATFQEWAAGETLDTTALMIEQAPAPAEPYFDGTAGGAWDGTPNNSTSTMVSAGGGTTWDDLPHADITTNLNTNPRPGSTARYLPNNQTYWQPNYQDGEVLITRLAAATGNSPDQAASMYNLGLPVYNPVLVAGAKYQREFEVWTDAPATVVGIAPAWVGGQSIPATTWTRLTEQFTGTGAAQPVFSHRVMIPGVGPGTHVKYRRVALVQIPDGVPTPLPYFDGSTPDTAATQYDWTGAADNSTSTATGLGVATTWDELGRMAVDNVSLKAPATGTQRTGMVFSGRITDMVAQFDDTAGGTVVEVTGADQRAELGNRDVGDEPWLEETLGSRFGRIVTASGQAIESRVSPTAAAMMVSWRDVDRQPAMTLLSELATSADGVLWAATHPTTGPYLLLESISDRKPQFLLVKVGGVITVVPADPAVTGAMEIDACDVLLEPIRWRHDIQDMATRVSVTWREQTLNNGQPAPTDRTITQVNTGLETDIGVHRVAVGTQLSRQTDAQMVTDAVLARTSNTQWRVSGLDWRADTTDQLDADALARMMTLLDGTTRNGLPILLTNVPEWSPIPQDQGVALYLEGGVYTSTDGGWDLSLVTSSARAQGGSDVRWDDQPDGTLLGTNQATNPRAVSGGSAQWGQAGWGTGGAGSVSYITGVTAPAGTNISTAFRKTWTTAATSATAAALALNGDASNRIPVTAGKTYTVSVFVRHNSIGTKNYEILLRWFNQVATSGGAQVGADVLSSAVSVADGVAWTRLSITVTAPAGALAMSVYPRIQIAATGAIPVNATQDGTGLLIEEAPAPVGAYFDGDTPDAAPIDYAWTGAANASTSTRTDLTTAWLWDQYGPDVTWNSLHGVGIS